MGMLELYFSNPVHRKQPLFKGSMILVALVLQPCWHLRQHRTVRMLSLDNRVKSTVVLS